MGGTLDGNGELVPSTRLDALTLPVAIEIPDSIEGVGIGLDVVGGALAAGGWATAAVVYAWTEPQQGARRDLSHKSEKLTWGQFAAHGFRGLTDQRTVAKHWRKWATGVEEGWLDPARRGERIVLPTSDYKLPRGSADANGDEWYTPKWIFDALGLVFSIDVCSPADRTYVNVPCESYYTEADDGLSSSSEWHGTVWCNPPYSTPGPWAERMVAHGDGLLLTHIPMNAAWCVEVWRACHGIRLFQGIEFVRPDGTTQRPGYWLQLAAFGDVATAALERLTPPPEVAANPRRVSSPMWIPVA